MYGTQLVLMGVTQYLILKKKSPRNGLELNTILKKILIVDCSDPVINYEI